MKFDVIVTGGAGFIGSHLVDRLIALGYRVLVVDNLSVGRESNLAGALESGKASLVREDVSKFKPGSEVASVKYLFHLAALADIVPSIEIPVTYHESNVNGTLNVLELARKLNSCKVVYAASSSCYGIPSVYPTPEDAPCDPKYPYALTKYLGEQYLIHWSRVYGLEATSLRFFNVYGPRARTSGSYGAVFGVFLAQKLAGKPLTVVGDGSQRRDFIFVDDIVDALVLAAESAKSGSIYNVGAGSPQSINTLVKLIGGDVTHLPKRPGEPDLTHADISKIKSELGWSPKISFEEGVSRMMSRILDWRDAPVWNSESIGRATKAWHHYLGRESEHGMQD